MDDRFELIIDVQSKGIRATEAELIAAQKAMDALRRENAKFAAVGEAVTAQLQKQVAAAKSGKGQWKVLTEDVKKARQAQVDYAAALKARDGALKSRAFEGEVQNLTRVEAAQRRLTKARAEYYNANRSLARANGSGDIERQTAALRRQTTAINAVAQAERTLVAAKRQQAQQDARIRAQNDRLQGTLTRAEGGLGNAREDQELKSAVANLRQYEAAQKRRELATRRVAEAERALARATASGDIRARIQATNDLTSAIKRQTTEQDHYADRVNAIRYANYDLASTLLRVAAGFTAVTAATAVSFASQEAAFTQVDRIVGGTSEEIGALRGELTDLSTQIPRSFQDLSGIAALGGALNIPQEALTQFTKTVATFAAVTGVTEEVAGTAFGRIAQYLGLTSDQYEALGSAILYAGNKSVATEEQVVKFTQALAPAADRVKFTTEQTVALGAAIASYGNINVEGAGGALTRLTNIITRAVQTGGAELENFAAISGMSASEFASTWETNSDKAFNSMLGGLSTVENLTGALDTLGITNTRDRRIVEGLAQNFDEFSRILAGTTGAYRDSTYMSEAYAKVLDDLASKWTMFLNGVMNAAAAIGSSFAPALKTALDLGIGFLEWATDFAATDMGQFFGRIAAALVITLAAWAALRGGIALATGATLAFRTATGFLAGTGLRGSILGLAQAMNLYTPAANGAATGSWNLSAGLKALGKATVVIAIVQLLVSAFLNLGDTVIWVGGLVSGLGQTLANISGGLSDLGFTAFENGAKQIQDFGKSIQDWGNTLPGVTSKSGEFGQQIQYGDDAMQDYIRSLAEGAEETGNLGDESVIAAEKVRTLTDYANDLKSVWDRAFEIRFGAQQSLDAITSKFLELQEAAEESRRKIAATKAEIAGLKSDINIKKQFLNVAIKYGDTTRAQAIEADLAEDRATLADKTADLNKEQETQNKTLVGNSAAAIANRATIAGLIQDYQTQIGILASSGLSTDELKRRTELLRQDFIKQATQLGFNRDELGLYTSAFDDVKVAIDKVPKNVTVDFNADPALQALAEFAERAGEVGETAGVNFASGMREGARNQGSAVGAALGAAISEGLRASLGAISTGALGGAAGSQGSTPFYLQDLPGYASPMGLAMDLGEWLRNLLGFEGGGYTGAGARNEPAGIVHRGEYVVPKPYVNQSTGLPYADALGRLQRGAQGRSGYSGGGYVNPPSSSNGHISSFGPMAQMQLRDALRQMLVLDSGVLAGAVGHQNSVGTAVGSR